MDWLRARSAEESPHTHHFVFCFLLISQNCTPGDDPPCPGLWSGVAHSEEDDRDTFSDPDPSLWSKNTKWHVEPLRVLNRTGSLRLCPPSGTTGRLSLCFKDLFYFYFVHMKYTQESEEGIRSRSTITHGCKPLREH